MKVLLARKDVTLSSTQSVGFEPTSRINDRMISNHLQYHYGNSADRSRRFMTAPILSRIFQIRFSDQSSRFSNSFVGFDQIYSIYTGKVFLGTSCLVGMAWYANPNISTLYFLFAASLDFENITPIQTTSWKTIKPYEVIIIKTPSLSQHCLIGYSFKKRFVSLSS